MSKQQEKQLIRTKLSAARANIDLAFKKTAAIQICQHIKTTMAFKQAKNIALYWPRADEASTLPILELAINLNKNCYLPVLHPDSNNLLLFLPYNHSTILTLNKYGIPEPEFHNNCKQALDVSQFAIIFIPLVAFDKVGNRLGMSKGYYDATLEKMLESPHRPLCLGVAYALQEVEAVPQDPWDVQLDGVVTELGIKVFNSNQAKMLCPSSKGK